MPEKLENEIATKPSREAAKLAGAAGVAAGTATYGAVRGAGWMLVKVLRTGNKPLSKLDKVALWFWAIVGTAFLGWYQFGGTGLAAVLLFVAAALMCRRRRRLRKRRTDQC